MSQFNAKNSQPVSIGPGEIYSSTGNKVIQTLLGSCIAACIYDPIAHVYGMNHFLLALKKNQSAANILNSKQGYYGIHAMELLINALINKGASRYRLKAKVFGGGNVLRQFNGSENNFFDIGRYNIEFVTEYLANEGIPILASSVGSNYGRIIYFDPSDFSVYQKRISHDLEVEIAQEEKSYVEHQTYTDKDVQFW